MAETLKKEKKKINPFLWILFAVVIPLAIIVAIITIILGVAGFNVIDWAKEQGSEIPIVSNFITTEEEQQTELQIENLTETLNSRDEEIELLNIQLADLEVHIEDLESEIAEQEQMIQETEETGVDAARVEEDESITEIAKTYEEMKSKNAAAILELMDEAEVLQILQEIPTDVRGAILEVMDREIAASLTQSLIE